MGMQGLLVDCASLGHDRLRLGSVAALEEGTQRRRQSILIERSVHKPFRSPTRLQFQSPLPPANKPRLAVVDGLTPTHRVTAICGFDDLDALVETGLAFRDMDGVAALELIARASALTAELVTERI